MPTLRPSITNADSNNSEQPRSKAAAAVTPGSHSIARHGGGCGRRDLPGSWMAPAMAVLLVLGWFAPARSAGDEAAAKQQALEKQALEKQAHPLMATKLRCAQEILAALSREDFDQIARNGRQLNEIGQQQWIARDDSRYRTQLQVFWFSSQQLARADKDKNLQGAAVAYVQLTLSCVNCHELVRDKKPASSGAKPGPSGTKRGSSGTRNR